MALSFIARLPEAACVLQYGSSVLKTAGGQIDPHAQVDLILAVKNPVEFHTENMRANPQDYSRVVRKRGAEFLVNSAARAAGIHYNTLVGYEGKFYKYGVISIEDLNDDLLNWRSFYLAGRLQKPVKVLKGNETVAKSMEVNYISAVALSCLIMDRVIPEEDLYLNITQLSFLGDRRLEDPQKVHNVVAGNFTEFSSIYRPCFPRISGILSRGNSIEVLPT